MLDIAVIWIGQEDLPAREYRSSVKTINNFVTDSCMRVVHFVNLSLNYQQNIAQDIRSVNECGRFFEEDRTMR